MTSRLDVLNDILDALGEPRAASATITSSTSDWIKRAERQIDRSAKIISERHDWNWMKSIEQLAPTDTEEPVGWQYEFNKPSNCLRIQKISIDGGWYSRPLSYEDRAGTLLTDSETSFLHYINQTRLDQVGAWPEVFAHAVALEAAWRACMGTTKSRAQRDDIKNDKEDALSVAKTWDGQQQPTKPRYPGSFVRAASGGWRSREND